MTGWIGLETGMAIRRWAMAEPEERLYPGTPRPMPDRVDYRFVNAWTKTDDLPCREALRPELPHRLVTCPEGPFDDLVLALDGPELDFSRFCHRPTLIVRGFCCLIRGRGAARFRLATAGGVRLWLGEEAVAVFEPFTRNQPQSTEVWLDLADRPTPLTLRLEDLHERDTTCFFSLGLLEGQDVATALPEAFEADLVEEVAAVMARLRTERVFYETGQVRLIADVPPRRPLRLAIANLAPFGRGGLVADPAAAAPVEVTLTPERPSVSLIDVAEAPPGCLSLRIEAEVGKARLVRQLGTTVLPPGHVLSGDLEARKRQAAELIASGDGFEPSLAALLAARGEQPARVAAILRAVLPTIEERHDCSDFSILPLLRLWRDNVDALDPALSQRLRDAFLGYRYWLDEPGDDVMWFWSENHVLCFHTAQLIAGRLLPDAVFANSGKTGRQHAAQVAARLERWFASIETHGLCEWNSAAYYPIDMLGLFTLYDMAPDFRARAGRLLDRLFVMAALHSTGSVPAGTQGRCYEKELLAGPMTELGAVMAVALGGAFRPGYDRATALFCLSDYAPPPLEALAAPAPGSWLQARYTQGLDHAGKLVLWKSAEAQLATVAELGVGERGHQAQVLDVQLARHPMARLWINHPGELKPWGERRPSLLAGNHVMPRVAQAGPVALVIYDLERPWTELHLTQLFADPDAFGSPARIGAWLVLAETVGVWCSEPLELVGTGLYKNALWRALALRVGWVVALRLPGEDPAAFRRRLAGAELVFERTMLLLRCAGLGALPLELRFDGPFRVGGQAAAFAPLSPLPHVAFDGGQLTAWPERQPAR